MDNQEFRTLNELFLKAIEKHNKPDAFLSKSGGQYRGLSSREAIEKTAALAIWLGRRGVKRSDRVAILSENRFEWALTDYAVLGLGAIGFSRASKTVGCRCARHRGMLAIGANRTCSHSSHTLGTTDGITQNTRASLLRCPGELDKHARLLPIGERYAGQPRATPH